MELLNEIDRATPGLYEVAREVRGFVVARWPLGAEIGRETYIVETNQKLGIEFRHRQLMRDKICCCIGQSKLSCPDNFAFDGQVPG
jgi:hypothetical protein